MKTIAPFAASVLIASFAISSVAQAQDAVSAAAAVESLFTSPDPKLHANKQVAYSIYPCVVADARDPTRTYTTTWYDTWRIRDGKANEH